MNKFLFLLLGIVSTGYTKEFSEEIIMIEPVSWDELQIMQQASLKLPTGYMLSENCPDQLGGFEHLTIKNTVFKEILWTHYFWTEFEDEKGEFCIIKHETINFFSKQSDQNPKVLKTPEYEILNKKQSAILLNAVESVEYDDIGINVLKRNISNHNQAVDDAKLKKYGGDARMLEYKRNNKPEIIPDEVQKIIDGKHDSSTATFEKKSFLERFESYYTKESLEKFAEEVKNNPTVDRFNGKYPFNSKEELLESVRQDLELIKSAKKPQHKEVKSSSNIYQIHNNDIAPLDPVINGQRNPVYPYALESVCPC